MYFLDYNKILTVWEKSTFVVTSVRYLCLFRILLDMNVELKFRTDVRLRPHRISRHISGIRLLEWPDIRQNKHLVNPYLEALTFFLKDVKR
jgi:hypothetical protein